ncbi:MAG TPA: Rrf2 family transcriptional regulator, partial [Candidatus Cloacimonadota bacterium]|nr:Rrf2 family transcriptional regulator [Candidatus Cloacimonadota bacterium]
AAKIVHSRAGSLGGYFLSRKAENISLADILAAVEDGTFDTACESESSRHCIGEGCRLTMFFLELNERLHQVFQSYSLADIVKIYNKG